MPDPIDELEGFTMPHTTPLPPGEVRRRGDRIRRRNNAIAAVGGLAVIAAIATPFAVLAGHHGSTAPQPAPAPDWTTTVPASFDLTAVPPGSPIMFTARDHAVVDELGACGSLFFSTKVAADSTGASYEEPGTESSAGRTLAVYANEQQAATTLADYRSNVESCPVEQAGDGPRLEYDVVGGTPASAEDGFVYSKQVDQGGGLYSDLSLYEVARVGNAIFVGATHGSAGGDQQVAAESARLADYSDPVLSQMCVFSLTGCGTQSEAVDPSGETGGLSGTIPDDFPLDRGLPTGTADGPGHEIDLAPYNLENNLAACGTAPSGLPTPVDTFYAGRRTPAEGHLRQLMTFDSTAEAQAYAEGVLVVFADCPEDEDGRGVSKLYTVTPGDVGDYAASAVMRVEVDGQPGTGYQVVQLVRVGRAVLQTLVVNDGDQVDAAGADQTSAALLEGSRPVVEAMQE